MKKDLRMKKRVEHSRQTEESMSDIIIPHSREKVKLQHTVCYSCLCLCAHIYTIWD